MSETKLQPTIWFCIFYIFSQQMRRQKLLNWMVTSVTQIQSVLNFLMNQIYLLLSSQSIWTFQHLQRIYLLSFMLWCPAFWLWDINMYLVSSVYFLTFMLPPSRFTSSAQARGWCVPFSSSPTLFFWTFLMAYSKAKLKSNDDKAYHILNLSE
jgi:hypothetical protein